MDFKPTDEQKRIFHFIRKRPENILIEAYAGAGKTTTVVEAVKLIPKDKNIMFLAFNKHIQEELKTKLPNYVRCYTTYGLGMSAIKRKYGDRIAIKGGLPLQTVLCQGTENEVRDSVQACIRTAGPSGYILSSSSDITAAVPARNYQAMIEAWREFRNN